MGRVGVTPPLFPQATLPQPLGTDAFDRANENPIAGNWTSGPGNFGDLQIVGNVVQSVTAGVDGAAYYNAVAWPDDQWSEVELRSVGREQGGPAVRLSATAVTGYVFAVNSGGTTYFIAKGLDGWTPTLASGAHAFAVGDVLRLEVQGNTLRAYVNGTLIDSVVDSDIPSGNSGLWIWDHAAGLTFDDWAGGGFAPGPAPAPPAAPTTLAAAAVSTSQINLSWTDNATTEDGFRIERCAGVGCTGFAEIATVGANGVSYQNTGLTASTSYSYRVRAYNAGGTSPYTNTATAMTSTPPPAPPVAPTTLAAGAVSTSQINLSWTDNATTEDGFRIERCAGVGCTGFAEIATVGANVVSYQNTGLTASTSYSYRVRAYNTDGTSAYSNTATAATPAPPAGDRLADLGMARLADLRIDQSNGRRRLRYSTTIVNVGSGKFEVRGRRANTGEPTMSVVQRVFNDAGGWRDVSTAGTMIFGGDGHNHWHVRDLQQSELFRLADDTYLAQSDKRGFCFWDNVRYRLSLPGAPQSPVYAQSGCGGTGSLTTAMGLSIGWGDIYPFSLPDQFIDVTALPDGRYRLVVTADPFGWFTETSEGNNFTWVSLELLGGGTQVRVLEFGPNATVAASQTAQWRRTWSAPRPRPGG
jgi:fibronectin type III domain protein/lysyl oxidase